MIVTLATPLAEATLARAVAGACKAEIVTCAKNEIADLAPAGDVLVLPGTWYSPDLAAALAAPSSRCKFVQLISAGYDAIDQTPRPAGVRFARVVGLWGGVTAEHALALLLGLTRRLRDTFAAQQAMEWRDSLRPEMETIDGASAAIVGTGEIGSAIAGRLRCLGADVTGISRSGSAHPAFHRVLAADKAGPALAASDIVILAVPLTPETALLADSAFFSGLKRRALFVNVARGGVVDQAALIAALESGHLTGAAIDVTEPEPLPPQDPLWAAPNLLITPHVGGGAPPRFYDRLAAYVAANCTRWRHGEPLNGTIS